MIKLDNIDPVIGREHPYPRGKRMLDWNKAANFVTTFSTARIQAGLAEDWGATHDIIACDGKRVPNGAYTMSTWATPVLHIEEDNGRAWVEECWVFTDEQDDNDASAYFPQWWYPLGIKAE